MRLPYPMWAFGVAGSLAAGLILAPAVSHAQAAPTGPNALSAPKLTPLTLSFLADKLRGLTPDFHDLATRAADYQNARVVRREAVADALGKSYAAEFARVSTDSLYTLNVTGTLQQYDPARQAWATGFSNPSIIPLSNPAGGTLQLTFDNIDDYDEVKMTPDAVERFAERNGLSQRSTFAATIVERFAVQISAAPPPLDNATIPVVAHIMAAELLNFGGRVIYTFPTSGGAPRVGGSEGAKSSQPEMTVNGVALGADQSTATAAVRKQYPAAREFPGQNFVVFADGVTSPTARPLCGRQIPSVSMGMPDDPEGTYRACVEFELADGKVSVVRSIQFLTGNAEAAVESALRAKYGPPSRVGVSPGGQSEIWVGTGPNGVPTEVDAEVGRVAGVTRLRVRAEYWTSPSRPRPVPATEGAPKL